jgi:hypothetical protein
MYKECSTSYELHEMMMTTTTTTRGAGSND